MEWWHPQWVGFLNSIKLATLQQAQRSISLVILCFPKVTPGTGHHSKDAITALLCLGTQAFFLCPFLLLILFTKATPG